MKNTTTPTVEGIYFHLSKLPLTISEGTATIAVNFTCIPLSGTPPKFPTI